MVTIRGEHISNIRPATPRRSQVYKSERPYARYRIRAKTTASGRVKEVCVKTARGIFSLAKGTHYQVLEAFNLSFDEIEATGWLLDNGQYYWK